MPVYVPAPWFDRIRRVQKQEHQRQRADVRALDVGAQAFAHHVDHGAGVAQIHADRATDQNDVRDQKDDKDRQEKGHRFL